MNRFTPQGSGSLAQRAPTAVVVALVVVLAGCSGLGVGGANDGESMPFMNHTTTDGVYSGSNSSEDPTVDTDGDANRTLSESELVIIANQTSNGRRVTVQSLTLSEGGYVVVHDARRMDAGLARNIIGVSPYLSPGTHENVTVTLFDVPGYDFGENAHLMGNVQVFVSLHHETNGNRTFEYVTSDTSEDGPYRNETGAIHVAFGTVTVKHETE